MPIIIGFTSRKKMKRSDIPSFILKKSQAKFLGLKKKKKSDILVLSHVTEAEYNELKSAEFKNVVLVDHTPKSPQLDLGI